MQHQLSTLCSTVSSVTCISKLSQKHAETSTQQAHQHARVHPMCRGLHAACRVHWHNHNVPKSAHSINVEYTNSSIIKGSQAACFGKHTVRTQNQELPATAFQNRWSRMLPVYKLGKPTNDLKRSATRNVMTVCGPRRCTDKLVNHKQVVKEIRDCVSLRALLGAWWGQRKHLMQAIKRMQLCIVAI